MGLDGWDKEVEGGTQEKRRKRLMRESEELILTSF